MIFFYHTHPPILERLKAMGYDATGVIVGEEDEKTIEEPPVPNDGIFAFIDKKDDDR